jgi:hypothetical protein
MLRIKQYARANLETPQEIQSSVIVIVLKIIRTREL